MGVERCPTCGQSLPAGRSRAQLEEKLKGEREREIRAALERNRPRMEAELVAKLMPKAKAEAKKELRAEIDRAHDQGRHEGERTLALERKRRQRVEQTTDQLKRQVKKLEVQLSTVSPQDRGDLAQEDIERVIRAACPEDEVSEVRQGQRGGDIIQDVRD